LGYYHAEVFYVVLQLRHARYEKWNITMVLKLIIEVFKSMQQILNSER